MTFNRQKFCAAQARAPYSLGPPARLQRAGYLLDAIDTYDLHMDLRWVAYIFATALWETGYSLLPVKEVGEGRGHPYGVKNPHTGQIYYGRGYCQTTWLANYTKIGALIKQDLVNNPDLLLQPQYAAPALIVAMERGIYTGKKLSDYFNAKLTDAVDARRIINGTDQARRIAAFYRDFYAALKLAA